MKNHKTFIINLKRRIDRKKCIIDIFNKISFNDYTFYEAIDGINIDINYEIIYLFQNNDFQNRKATIGCALSHYNIWIDLINDETSDYYIIFEDDIKISDNFILYLNKVKEYINNNLDIDFLFLGYLWHNEKERDNYFSISDLDIDHYIGGFHSYIITKNGANQMINYIKNNGIKHGIDYLVKIIPSLTLKLLYPLIVHAEWYNGINNIDTDIQTNYEVFDFSYLSYQKYEPVTKKVKMLCDWCDSSKICEEWNVMSKGNFEWNNIKITSSDDNIDYYVIINKTNDNSYNPSKTIIFQMEPWVNNPNLNWGVKTWGIWAIPDSDKFMEVRGRKTEIYNNGFWQLEYNYEQLKKMNIKKTYDKLSTICSSKYCDEGHIKRVNFIKFLEEKNDINIDIYNYDNVHQFKNYKGPLYPYVDKSKGLIPYKYYFMIENNFERNFITEKLWEAIICESLIFYYGAPNVSDYLNPLSYVLLDINDFEKSYKIIKNAIENDLWSERINIIKEEKYKILNYYNFFPTIERIICKNIWKNNLALFNKTTRVIILNENYKTKVLSMILKELNFNVELYQYFDESKLEIKNIKNSLDKKIIYDKNDIKYSAISDNNIKKVYKKIQLFEYLLKDNSYNYLIIDGELEIESLDVFLNHILLLPDDYDYCQLNFSQNDKPLIKDQYNKLYYTLKDIPFKLSSSYFISKNGLEKILIHIKNYIKYESVEFIYRCYQNIKDFNIYTTNHSILT